MVKARADDNSTECANVHCVLTCVLLELSCQVLTCKIFYVLGQSFGVSTNFRFAT